MQLNLDAINKWLTLISNLGVAAGFVLLATQVDQSADEIRLERVAGRLDGSRSASVAMLGDTAHEAFSTAMLRPSELTAGQITQLWAQLEMYVLDAEEMFTARQAGYATERDWEIARRGVVISINHPVGQILWHRLKASYHPDLVQEIDRELARAKELDWPEAYQGILKDLKALPSTPSDAPAAQP